MIREVNKYFQFQDNSVTQKRLNYNTTQSFVTVIPVPYSENQLFGLSSRRSWNGQKPIILCYVKILERCSARKCRLRNILN